MSDSGSDLGSDLGSDSGSGAPAGAPASVPALKWNQQENNSAQPWKLVFPGSDSSEDSSLRIRNNLNLFYVKRSWMRDIFFQNNSEYDQRVYADSTFDTFEEYPTGPDTPPWSYFKDKDITLVYGMAGKEHMLVNTTQSANGPTSTGNTLIHLKDDLYALKYPTQKDKYRLNVREERNTWKVQVEKGQGDWPGKMLHATWVPQHSPVWNYFNTRLQKEEPKLKLKLDSAGYWTTSKDA